MKTWKQPTLLSLNSSKLTASIMIIETNKSEGEEYLFYFYKTNDSAASLVNFKGVFLAASEIANSIFYEDIRILSFTYNNASYKSSSKNYLKNYLICVIIPSITPDNIILFILDEFIKFCTLFFENFEDSKKFFNVLNKYAEILFYMTSNYSLRQDKEDIVGTPISLLPIMNLTFSYNEMFPCYMIKPGINDSLRTDLIEHMNTLNSDRSVLQETLTLMEPPFYIKGYVLLYNGFVLFNTLNNKGMSNGARLALLHEMYMRSYSSPEILSCEFLFEDDNHNDINGSGNSTGNGNGIGDNPSIGNHKKKTLTTLLAQREFVLIISLEILGKNNCSFDPFYHKRAEDLLVNLLKKNFSSIINNELFTNSIKMQSMEGNQDERSVKDIKEMETVVSNNKSNSKNSINEDINVNANANANNKRGTNPPSLNLLTSKIKGYIDSETNMNIIHFSCYDDAECIINTTDLNVTAKLYKDLYRFIFNTYARMQTNINKLKTRNKQIKLSQLFSYGDIKKENVNWKNSNVKKKIARNYYIQSFPKQKVFKINEFGAFFNNGNWTPVWICCKVYEHITIEDDINMDEYSNYKIIFVAYESHHPVEIDSFCQDLLMNELFI